MSAPSRAPHPVDRAAVGSLFDLDDGWLSAVPVEDRVLARRVLTVRGINVTRGRAWDGPTPGDAPLLLLEGLLWRETALAGGAAAELLGPGDVMITPATRDEGLKATVTYRASSPVRLGVLGERFDLAARRWPALQRVLQDRLVARSDRQAEHAAILHLQRVEDRVHAVLVELAGRFGRVTGEGLQLSIGLTHVMVGKLVGARRSTVTLAFGVLRDRDLVLPQHDGWLLTPAGLAEESTVHTLPGGNAQSA